MDVAGLILGRHIVCQQLGWDTDAMGCQRTRLSDLPLTERTEQPAQKLGDHLKRLAFANASWSHQKKGYYDDHKHCGTAGKSKSYKIRNRRSNPNGASAYFKSHPAIRLWPGSVLRN